MKKITFFLCAVFLTMMGYSQGHETFDDFTSSGTSYEDGSFIGQDGSTWEYLQARGDAAAEIEDGNQALMLAKDKTPDAHLTSGILENGIGTLNFTYKQAFGSDVNMKVYVNDDLIYTATSDDQMGGVITTDAISVDVDGDFTLKFFNPSGAGQVNIDDIIWTESSGDGDNPCAAIIPPWNEDFESGSSGNLITVDLTCWNQEFESGAHNWNFSTSNQNGSITPHSGSLMAEFRNTNTGPTTKLITPSMDLTSLSTPLLTFYFANVNWSGDIDELRVYYKQSASDSDWTLIDGAEYTTEHTSWEEVELILPDADGASDYVIAFEATSNYAQGLNLDDVSIGEVPSCLHPTDLAVDNFTTDSADISWTAGADETAWEVLYGEAGFDVDSEGTSEEVAVTNITLEDLEFNTSYEVYVRAVCSSDDQSDWEGPVSFTTNCLATDIPFTQDFEDVTVPDLPNCGTLETIAGNDWKTFESVGFDSQVLNYSYSTSEDANTWYFTQGINLEEGVAYQISYKYGNAGTWAEKLKVAFGTSSQSSAMDTELVDYTNILDIETDEIIFDVPADGVYYFGFNAHSDANENQLYVDDIHIDVAPTCLHPTDLAVDNITADSADISWTAAGGDETQWEVVYGETGFDQDVEGESTLADATSTTITDLDSDTEYDVYVRSVCGEDDYSDWVGPENFTTEGELGGSYCEGEGVDFGEYGGVENFSTSDGITNIDNLGIEDPTGYHNLTDMVVSQTAGESFTFTADIQDLSLGDGGIAVYIDYNNNFEFESNQNELVYTTITFEESVTATITIPEDTDPGNYRLRVVSDADDISPDPCLAQSSIHDYTLTVIGDEVDCEAPTDIEVELLAPTFSLVTWSGNADNYEIAWGISPYEPGDEGGSQFTTGNTNLYYIGTEADTEYDVYVSAICGDTNSDWISISFTSPEGGECQAPSGLTLNNITEDSAEFTWSPANDGDNKWEISLTTAEQSADDGIIAIVSDTPSYTATGLEAETEYSVYLRTICSDEESSNWAYQGDFETLEGTTAPEECEIPTNVEITNITDSTAEVSWTAGGDETQWEVLYGQEGFDTDSEGTSVLVNVTSYTIAELDSETEYDVYVRSVCGDDYSDWVGPETFTTEEEPLEVCEAPTDVEVTNITDTTAEVSWTPGGEEMTWAVIYGESGFTLEEEEDYQTNIVLMPNHTLENLIPETDYDVYVFAICDEEDMIYSDIVGPITFLTDDMSVDSQEFTNFTYYPNPVENQLSLKAGVQIENVQVYNLLGQSVISAKPNSLEAQINTEALQSGVYLMEVNINGSQKTFRIVKK